MTKAKTAAEKRADAKAAREAKAAEGGSTSDSPQVTLPKGKGTQDDDPPPSNPAPIERGKGDRAPKEPRGEDVLRQNTDKAVWGYGASNASPKELMDEQAEITEASK